MKWNIRKMQVQDCKSIAHIVTVAWNETYRGIVNDIFLSNLSKNEEERIKKMENSFNMEKNHSFVLEINGNVVGFVQVVDGSEEYNDYGEIQAIYILEGYKGFGYGKKLFNQAIKEIKSMGYDKMVVSCLEKNSTNEFYKKMGGKYNKQRLFSLPNQDLVENIYLYKLD